MSNEEDISPTERLEKEGVSFIKILVISKIVIIAVVGAVAWWWLKDI
ncbi:MAG: hypothetical protein L3J94_02385 [Gammaproteobacteria bacterium]|nr:hypothetical protein [Gammaproteobacteria bacterium]